MFRKMLYILPALVLSLGACVSGPAEAETVIASWVNPTTNTDNSAIPAAGDGALTSARVAWSICAGPGVFGTEAGFVTRAMPVTTATVNLAPGNWCVRVTVVNSYGETSDPSNVAARTVAPPKPRAPTGVTVSAAP